MTRSVASDGAASEPPREGFGRPRAARLRSAREIRRTMRAGRCTRGRFVNLFSAPSPSGRPRVGIVTPRHGRSAVARNRLRRRLTEISRLDLVPALEDRRLGLDLILRAKPKAYAASYVGLRATLVDALESVCED